MRFDDTEIPGLHSTVGYLDLRCISPSHLAELIKEKIGPINRDNFLPEVPDRLYDTLGTGPQRKNGCYPTCC